MEWWILLGLAAGVLGVAVLGRLRKSRHRKAGDESKNIYPLW
jgi:hypothetical protein